MVRALTQNQLTRSPSTRIGYFEIWNNSFISINLAYLRKIWPPLILSNWYLGTNFFCKGSDTSFTSQVSPPFALSQLILSQGSNHPLVSTSFSIFSLFAIAPQLQETQFIEILSPKKLSNSNIITGKNIRIFCEPLVHDS